MVIQYKRGYGPQYTVHDKTLSSPHLKRTWGIKVPVEEEPNQLPLTLLFVLDQLFLCLPLLLVDVERVVIKASIQVFLIPYFLISLINQTCRKSDHNHVQCFVCFHYWFIIVEHVLSKLFLLKPKFPT